MSDTARIIILCEDIQQEVFVRRFLVKHGLEPRDIRVKRSDTGSAAQWVLERFPRELRAYRSKCNHMRNGLIAVIDADTHEVVDRIKDFDKECEKQGVETRKPEERTLYVIPKRNVETWLAYLRGDQFDEVTAYDKYKGRERDCKNEVMELDAMCQKGRLGGNPPASLQRCCAEFQSFWRSIQ